MQDLAGKYLSFSLDQEEYGIEILKVREIIGIMDITAVPQMPDYVKGVINLRGKVIPVIDLRLKFGVEERQYDSETCIIVVLVGESLMGVVVDRVCEVRDVDAGALEPPPDFGSTVQTNFMLGMAKLEDKVVMLVDINGILLEELTKIKKKI